jgi:hypothetical protein
MAKINPLDRDSIAGQWLWSDNISSLLQDWGASLKALMIIVNIVTYQFVISEVTCVVGRAPEHRSPRILMKIADRIG